MTGLRILPNPPTRDPAVPARVHAQTAVLEAAFDIGWTACLGGPPQPRVGLPVPTWGTDLPTLTITVENLDDALARLRGPDGNLVTVAAHPDAC